MLNVLIVLIVLISIIVLIMPIFLIMLFVRIMLVMLFMRIIPRKLIWRMSKIISEFVMYPYPKAYKTFSKNNDDITTIL